MSINSAVNIHNVVICVNIFVKKDGKYLVIKRSAQKEVLPNAIQGIGGKVEPYEDPFVAAQRELLEESGLIAENLQLKAVVSDILDKNDPQYGDNNHWLVFYFVGDYKSGDLKTTEEGELVWLTPDELVSSQQTFYSLRELAQYIVSDETGHVFAKFQYDLSRNIVNKLINVCKK